jgi:hypothetical protein
MPAALTFIYTYYDNPLMLATQYRNWISYPERLKSQIKIVLVDDASPMNPAADVWRPAGLPKLEIYRVLVDVPWHQDGARNLGATVADDGWMFCCDMDHVMPADSLRNLLGRIERAKPAAEFFTFPRRDMPHMRPVKKGPGANIFAITRWAYWNQMGGYDEDMCGQYGSDGEPRRRLLKHSRNIVLDNCAVIRFERHIIADASTVKWERKGPENERRRQRAIQRKVEIGRMNQITHLDFEWSRVL